MIQSHDVYDSDAVILDLEDSVAVYDKDAARELVRSFLAAHRGNVEVFVRINDVDSGHFHRDVSAVDDLAINGYVLPKANPQAIDALAKACNHPILPIIEDPQAVLDAYAIVRHPQVKGAILGAEDLTKEMMIERTSDGIEIHHVRSHLALVCHALQKPFIDTPWTVVDDLDGLAKDASLARSLGATGKAAIHPNHVALINDLFGPSESAIRDAERILAKASETGKGAFRLDGKMIDEPIVEKARRLIAAAARYNKR